MLRYTFEHRRRFIHFVTPQQRHTGVAQHLRDQPDCLYRQECVKNPQRWSKIHKNRNYIDRVNLNPDSTPSEQKNTISKGII